MEINGLHMDHHSNGQVRSNNGDHRVLNVLCVSSLWLLDINIIGMRLRRVRLCSLLPHLIAYIGITNTLNVL